MGSLSAKRVVDPGGGLGEGTRAAEAETRHPARRPGDWRDRHLRACIACGRVWRRRRRRTCPGCGSDYSICLTCDRARPEEDVQRRCPEPVERLRRLVKACAGDWEWARRTLAAAGGDVARAIVMLERHHRHSADLRHQIDERSGIGGGKDA